MNCYDKFLKSGKRGSYGGSSRPSRPSTSASTALSTPLSSQPSVAKRSSASLGDQLLGPARQAELDANAIEPEFDLRVPGWTKWTCTPEQQATWKKEAEKMSLDQLESETKRLQDELAMAKKARNTQVASLKVKIDKVRELEAQVSEFNALLDVKYSLQKKQEKLGETLGTEDSLEVTDSLLGILNEYFRSGDAKQFVRQIDWTRESKF